MIVVDELLAGRVREGRPVGVAVAGAGFMARGLLRHVATSVPGLQVRALYARRPEQARATLEFAGLDGVRVTDDVDELTSTEGVEVVVDATGAVEFGAVLALSTIAAGRHLVLLNAEVDATVGGELARRAAEAGVVYTGVDGDQPGVQMNLVRFVRGLGLTPLVAGNVKGLQDRFRNPTTQEGFAKRWGQDPHMVTSFADGTKVNIEQALVANATGMGVHRRGLLGMDHDGHVDELTSRYDVDELRALGGAVDYVVGAKPGPGVYVLAECPDPPQRHYLELYKLGTGPLYSFYTPYHLCHFEVPTTIARAALLGDAAIRPLDRRTVDVVTVAKKGLSAGTELDALGGYTYYGECESTDAVLADRLLPVGLAQGCRLVRDVAVDQVVTYADVEVPAGRVADRLRAEQDATSAAGV